MQNTTPTLYDIQYGTGEAQVKLVYDAMSIAGVNITNQGFGTATYLTSDFTQTSCDGLVVRRSLLSLCLCFFLQIWL